MKQERPTMVQIVKRLIMLVKFLRTPPDTTPRRHRQSRLKVRAIPLALQLQWTQNVSNALCMSSYVNKDEGIAMILVADRQKQLHIFDVSGHLRQTVPLPAPFFQMECGYHKQHGILISGASAYRVHILNLAGTTLWTHVRIFGSDEAHWGDLDGDGNDEVILGRCWSGLLARTSHGRSLWNIRNIHNVWSHTIMPKTPQHAAYVFATEASGAIHVYDAQGQLVKTLRPNNLYYSILKASPLRDSKGAQIAAIGSHEPASYDVLAFDCDGNVAWSTPTNAPEELLIQTGLACGDLNGDGSKEWVFFEREEELSVVSSDGEKIASVSDAKGYKDFKGCMVVPQPDGYGILITLETDQVHAYRVKRGGR